MDSLMEIGSKLFGSYGLCGSFTSCPYLRKGDRVKENKVMFAVGLIIALVAALMMFCQERCFLGVDLEGCPMVLGIIGIGLIATSQYRPLKSKK